MNHNPCRLLSRSSPPQSSRSSCRDLHSAREEHAPHRRHRSSSPNSGSRRRRRKQRSESSGPSQPDFSFNPHLHLDPAVQDGLMRSGGSSRSGGSRRSKSTRSRDSLRTRSARSQSGSDASGRIAFQRPESLCSNKVPSGRISDIAEQPESKLLPRTQGWVKSPYGGYIWADADYSVHRQPARWVGGYKRNPIGGRFWMQRTEPADRRCSNPELAAQLHQLSESRQHVTKVALSEDGSTEYQGNPMVRSSYGMNAGKEGGLGGVKKHADPTIPGPGFSRTSYGGFYSRYRCVY